MNYEFELRTEIFCIKNYYFVMMLEDPEPKFMVSGAEFIICINNYNFVIIFEDPEPNFRIREEL